MASAPSMFPSFLVVVFFVVIFLRHGRNCRTIPWRLKLVTLPRGPTLQWRHGHREGRVRGMVPVKFLPLVFTRNSALEMCLYIEKALGKRQLFQTCHGSCHHILRSSLLTSTQMLSLGFMVQCGHLAVLLIPAGRRKKAIAGLHFQQLTFSLNSVSVQGVSKGKN